MARHSPCRNWRWSAIIRCWHSCVTFAYELGFRNLRLRMLSSSSRCITYIIIIIIVIVISITDTNAIITTYYHTSDVTGRHRGLKQKLWAGAGYRAPSLQCMSYILCCKRYNSLCQVWYRALSFSALRKIMYSINQSITHSGTHPAYLMPWELKLLLRNINTISSTYIDGRWTRPTKRHP